jgi:hypothetical protein
MLKVQRRAGGLWLFAALGVLGLACGGRSIAGGSVTSGAGFDSGGAAAVGGSAVSGSSSASGASTASGGSLAISESGRASGGFSGDSSTEPEDAGAQCPSGYAECCDHASGLATPTSCDAAGNEVCVKGSQLTSLICGCGVWPAVCQVSGPDDLWGQPCSLGDPVCAFDCGKSTTWCDCTSRSGAAPTWSCISLP